MVIKDRSKKDFPAPCLGARLRSETEWGALTPDQIAQFNRKVVCRTYNEGQVIFVQGDPCQGLYFIDDGLVAVRKVGDDGRSVIVRLAYQGDTLGYRPLLSNEDHRATAEVINESRICFIDAPTMRGFLLGNPKLGVKFLEHTAQALGAAEERLFQVAALSVRARIIHLLILLRDHYGTTTSDGTLFVELPMTRNDLAEMIGARPESVSRALRGIQDDGLLNLSGRTVRVNQVDRLINELHQNLHN